jgi:hypothetical protein
MQEEEWLGCNSSQAMLSFLRGKVSERKLRLFALACCARIDALISDPRSRAALTFVESHLESGLARRKGRPAAVAAAEAAQKEADSRRLPRSKPDTRAVAEAAYSAAGAALATLKIDPWFAANYTSCCAAYAMGSFFPGDAEWGQQAWLLRDVFGNPFRPVTMPPPHRTHTVVSLARAAYDERHLPSGDLDPLRLAVLADALEEAGAPGELVAHLRGPGPHVRGCFAVDLCLGLS